VQLTRTTIALATTATVAIAMVLTHTRAALAVPQYSAQAGRTCDSCHLLPGKWDTPGLAHQKRNMSCGTCHVDPSGGGMRTASGRYFGRSTLAMIATSPRPQDDWARNFPGIGHSSRPADLPESPRNLEEAPAYRDSVHDKWAWGIPKGITPDTPFPGRFFKLNPDPIFRIGGDFRFALLAEPEKTLMFPMQLDMHAALHPVHHATVLANVGARGQSSGYSDTIDDSHTPYFRELLAMTHEWPYQTYAKAGRFVPAFGLKLDDHTTSTRREFELDTSLPESRVLGVEVGAVAAYPFLQASYFKLKNKYEVPDAWNIFDVDDGWGSAVNAGWRDLGWSLGASAMWRRRPLEQGGDTDTYGFYGSFNPWYFKQHLPVTLQGEIDAGIAQRASGLDQHTLAMYAEADWMAWNGVTFLAAYDWADPDRDVIDDESGRFQIGGKITVYPGVMLDSRIRFLQVATPTGNGTDFFTQLHLWF